MQHAFQSWLNERKQGVFHRQLLVIQGSPDWTRQQAQALTSGTASLWVGEGEGQILSKNYRQQLGREWDNVVYDLRAGVSANALVALSGTVRRGGLMVLLAPVEEQWAEELRGLTGKLSYGVKKHSGLFCQWLQHKLQHNENVAILHPDSFNGVNQPVNAQTTKLASPYASQEQELAVQAIIKVACGHRNRPLVLTADRGRGKTSALGLAAAQLLKQGKQVLITAPHIDAVAQAFTHASQQLGSGQSENGCIKTEQGSLKFVPVDVLLKERSPADLLLIDEAAAIPAPQLKRLLNQYNRLVFSSTIHGYEGSGRGFDIRFKPYLQTQRPQWRSLHISAPLRWHEGDCLEQFWFDALLMQDAPANKAPTTEPLQLHQHSAEQLASSPQLLHQIFELLVNAHYQTSPDDLQRILDAPDLQLYSLQQQGQLLGAMLVQSEGGNALTALAEPISQGERRVQGHLLAQNLSAYLCEPALATLSHWRIVRIAMHPQYRRQGHGLRMLKELAVYAKIKGVDSLGTAYGATNELLAFWHKAGFAPVRLGHKLDAASGEHSVLMLYALNEQAEYWQHQLLAHFCSELQHLLPSTFRQLDSALVLQLTGILCQPQPLSIHERRLLTAFAAGMQPLENLHLAMLTLLTQPHSKKQLGAAAAARYVLQGWDRQAICAEYGLTGKRQLAEYLRRWVKLVLDEAL